MLDTIYHLLGLDNAASPEYLWWSGIGADFSELALVGGLLGLLRQKNCEVHGCWRLGRHTSSTSNHSVCRKHLPTGPVTPEDIV